MRTSMFLVQQAIAFNCIPCQRKPNKDRMKTALDTKEGFVLERIVLTLKKGERVTIGGFDDYQELAESYWRAYMIVKDGSYFFSSDKDKLNYEVIRA